MKLSFYGAARMVTGSCFGLAVNGVKLLIDCGLRQGRDDNEISNEYFEFNPAEVDAVIVTHAHIDHSGRIPLLKKRGFNGKIYATELTSKLLSIMLRDSAYIHEMEAQWKNQKGKRSGQDVVEPLYTIADAEAAMAHIHPLHYGTIIRIADGVKLRFTDAGHLLGSSSVELLLTENNETRKIVFSGDIGNLNQPIIKDPQYISDADYVVMESTYGDRDHEPPADLAAELAKVLNSTFAKGGNVIIPAFAVGRTQELLYHLREIKEKELVTTYPHFEVYVDSPLANEATRIYSGNLSGYLDADAERIIREGGEMINFADLRLSQTADESKALNTDKKPKVIISASGMCEAGRIRHHLKHNLWRSECAVVFVGFQAIGTLGRTIADGAKKVKLFGEEIIVRAQIVNLQGMSAHADKSGLIKWITQFTPSPKHVFVVHGEDEVSELFAAELKSLGIKSRVPDDDEVFDLVLDRVDTYGTPIPERKKKAYRGSQVYEKLLAAGTELLTVIEKNKGLANKELSRFTDQIKSLIDKWS
ncbi:MAG: MBL fold metallo-hydrolase [Clostridiales bacterium]|nr:MBL fold metallo-hydrolase [Clostridiales bacterium]